MLRWTPLAMLALVLLFAARPVDAGKYNTKFNIGDSAPAFADLPGTDGKKHSLADYKQDVLVLAITCNHCPVAVAYEERLVAFQKKFGGKVALVAINVNNIDDDKLPKMKERAEAKGFTFDYLHDASQKVARDLGATVTPEFFVFDKSRKLVYMGAMDNATNAANAKVHFVEQAVTAALEGKTPATAETKGRGCGVLFE